MAGLSEKIDDLLNQIQDQQVAKDSFKWQKGELARTEYALKQSQAEITTAEVLSQAENMASQAEKTVNAVAENRQPNTKENYLHPAGYTVNGKYGPVSFYSTTQMIPPD